MGYLKEKLALTKWNSLSTVDLKVPPLYLGIIAPLLLTPPYWLSLTPGPPHLYSRHRTWTMSLNSFDEFYSSILPLRSLQLTSSGSVNLVPWRKRTTSHLWGRRAWPYLSECHSSSCSCTEISLPYHSNRQEQKIGWGPVLYSPILVTDIPCFATACLSTVS